MPGGYRVGDKVFCTAPSVTFSNGDRIVHGGQGEVVGGCIDDDGDEVVRVLFPGNEGTIECLLTKVRRLRAVPLPPPPACAPHARRCSRP